VNEIQDTALIVESGMGKAYPLGATVTQDGCNFAVYAPDAKAVVLCFFNSDTEEAVSEHPLPEKTGDVWHGRYNGVSAGQYYGCLLYTSPSPRDRTRSRMPSSA